MKVARTAIACAAVIIAMTGTGAETAIVVARVNGTPLTDLEVFGAGQLQMMRRVAEQTKQEDTKLATDASARYAQLMAGLEQQLTQAIATRLLLAAARSAGVAERAEYVAAKAAYDAQAARRQRSTLVDLYRQSLVENGRAAADITEAEIAAYQRANPEPLAGLTADRARNEALSRMLNEESRKQQTAMVRQLAQAVPVKIAGKPLPPALLAAFADERQETFLAAIAEAAGVQLPAATAEQGIGEVLRPVQVSVGGGEAFALGDEPAFGVIGQATPALTAAQAVYDILVSRLLYHAALAAGYDQRPEIVAQLASQADPNRAGRGLILSPAEQLLIGTYLAGEGVQAPAADEFSEDEIAAHMAAHAKVFDRRDRSAEQRRTMAIHRLQAERQNAAREALVARLRNAAKIETMLDGYRP